MKKLKFAMALFMFSALFAAEEKPQSKPFFQAKQKQPYHLSIGAVLFDQNGRIACQLTQWNPEDRDLADPEASSTIEWLEPNTLISLMQQQGVRFEHRADADESEMVKRAIPYIIKKK